MNFPELMSTVESSTSIELIYLLMRRGLIKSSVRVMVTLTVRLGYPKTLR